MGGACLATAIRPSLHGQGAPSHAQHSTFCVPHRRNRPASDPEAGENCPLTPPPSLWQCRAMLGETKNQFSLTRVASSTCGRMKSKFLSVKRTAANLQPGRFPSGSATAVREPADPTDWRIGNEMMTISLTDPFPTRFRLLALFVVA